MHLVFYKVLYCFHPPGMCVLPISAFPTILAICHKWFALSHLISPRGELFLNRIKCLFFFFFFGRVSKIPYKYTPFAAYAGESQDLFKLLVLLLSTSLMGQTQSRHPSGNVSLPCPIPWGMAGKHWCWGSSGFPASNPLKSSSSSEGLSLRWFCFGVILFPVLLGRTVVETLTCHLVGATGKTPVKPSELSTWKILFLWWLFP